MVDGWRGCGVLSRVLRGRDPAPRARQDTASTRFQPRVVLVISGMLVATIMPGCGATESLSAQRPLNAPGTSAGEAHTRFDVLFARDIIEHSSQAVALSNLVSAKEAVAPEIVAVARRTAASSVRRSGELQALLSTWGFAPMAVSTAPRPSASNRPVQPGDHPLASDVEFRRLTDAVGARAADVYLELMIRQHQFTISAARDQLRSGAHPEAMAIARQLIESQQAETSAMEALQR